MFDDNLLVIAIGIVFQVPNDERFKWLGQKLALIEFECGDRFDLDLYYKKRRIARQTGNTPRIDSLILLPKASRCLMRMLPLEGGTSWTGRSAKRPEASYWKR